MSLGNLIKLGLSISENISKHQEIERARSRAEAAREEATAQSIRAQAETAEYNRTRLEAQIAAESVAVECPNCGSTSSRIRVGSTGNCSFCGTAIRVSRDGIAYIAGAIDDAKSKAEKAIRESGAASSASASSAASGTASTSAPTAAPKPTPGTASSSASSASLAASDAKKTPTSGTSSGLTRL